MITNAINDAYERGVRVRYITCESTTTAALGTLNSNIPRIERPEGMGIMHNKFIVVDADVADSAWVLSGSTNWTSSQIFDDPNHIIMVQDQSVARTYELEFNEMWGSDGNEPDDENAKFGSNKTNNTPHHFIVNGNDFEVYFSPTDNTTLNISNALKSADDEIDFALLVFTNNQLGTTIAEEHESGVEVNGIIEQINTEGSEYDFLVEEGVNVISHQGFGDSFHHKYCIVDHDNTDSDPLVITGSHNWSGAAETNNDENTMIIHDANIANQFFQEFNERMNEIENQVEPSFNCVGEACIDPMDGSGTYSSLVACEYVCSPASIHELVQGNIQVYPNPNEGKFTIQINSLISTTLKYRISDLQGKIVVENKVNLLKGMNKLEINENITTGFYFVEMANERIKIIVQ
jgi:phosphatidylserine/phosphatidylglycerophosphate/cardiolipin synthase-like enzyme